jgi:hypothetical protein
MNGVLVSTLRAADMAMMAHFGATQVGEVGLGLIGAASPSL